MLKQLRLQVTYIIDKQYVQRYYIKTNREPAIDTGSYLADVVNSRDTIKEKDEELMYSEWFQYLSDQEILVLTKMVKGKPVKRGRGRPKKADKK